MNRRHERPPTWNPGPVAPNADGLVSTGAAEQRHAVTSDDLQRLREDIARTRQELGETIEALSARLDVKARTRQGLQRAGRRAAELARPVRQPSPVMGAVVGAGVAAGLVLVALLLRRGRTR